MMIVKNPRGDIPVEVPTRADGGYYRFVMTYDGFSKRAFADSLTELIDALIPGYLAVDNAEADYQRLRYLIRAQVQLQALVLNDDANRDAVAMLSDDERRVLLGSRATQPEVTAWDCAVPLVLIDSYFEPVCRLPRPEGNIIWLSPLDEFVFLKSLAEAGMIDLAEREEDA